MLRCSRFLVFLFVLWWGSCSRFSQTIDHPIPDADSSTLGTIFVHYLTLCHRLHTPCRLCVCILHGCIVWFVPRAFCTTLLHWRLDLFILGNCIVSTTLIDASCTLLLSALDLSIFICRTGWPFHHAFETLLLCRFCVCILQYCIFYLCSATCFIDGLICESLVPA